MMPERWARRNAGARPARRIPRAAIVAPLHLTHQYGMMREHEKETRGRISPAGLRIRSWPEGRASPACEPLYRKQGTRSMTIISRPAIAGNVRRLRASASTSAGRGVHHD
jgi:hypothetical protein